VVLNLFGPWSPCRAPHPPVAPCPSIKTTQYCTDCAKYVVHEQQYAAARSMALDAEKLIEYVKKNPQNFMYFYCEILQGQQEKEESVLWYSPKIRLVC